MAASSAVILRQFDAFSTAPNAGALYIQAVVLGVIVEQPGGANLILGPTEFTGGGPVKVDEGGVNASYGGYPTAMPQRAVQLQGGVMTVTAGTVLPAPDFTPWSATGATSRIRINVNSDIDWVGGIAVPTIPGGGSPFGTILEIQNVSAGSGATMNIIDTSLGGGVHVPGTSVALGFLETASFVYDNNGWSLRSNQGVYFNNGGNSGSGSRTITSVSSVVPIPLIKMPKGNTTVPATGFIAQVSAESIIGAFGTGVDVAWWYNVRMSWDGFNNPVGVLTIDDVRGTGAGGAPPFGWALTVSIDGSNFNLNFIGDGAHTVKARAKWCPICPPF